MISHVPRRTIAAAVLAAAAAACLALAGRPVAGLAIASDGVAMAADPSATSLASPDDRGDLRSSGEGSGIVGAPAAAVGTVLLIGLASAGVTAAYVRLTGNGARGGPR
jgi:hypothetical protein